MSDGKIASRREEGESLSKYTAAQLRSESRSGLKIFAETGWGWSELKVSAFVKQVDKAGSTILAYTEVRNDGGITLKVPCRVQGK